MDNQIYNQIVSFIWSIADDCLRDVYVRGKYRDVILPMTVIRRLDAMLEDKDILKTIATVTRSDCKLYPRPTEFSKLMGYPFRFSLDEVEGAAARMQLREEYGDIGVVQASNGAKAFYSSQFVKEGYARALLEGSEVEAHEWP